MGCHEGQAGKCNMCVAVTIQWHWLSESCGLATASACAAGAGGCGVGRSAGAWGPHPLAEVASIWGLSSWSHGLSCLRACRVGHASCPWHMSLPQPLGAQCAYRDASHCSVPANVGNVPFQPPCWKNDEFREMAVLLQCRAINPEFIPHEVSLLDLISNGSLV